MATLTRVQHDSMTTTSTTAASFAATLGSGVTTGNLLVVTVTIGTNITLTVPSGWIQAGPAETVTGDLQSQIYYLIVTSGMAGETSWTWSWTGSHSFGWTIDEWHSSTGWQSGPIDSSAGANSSAGSAAVNCGSPDTTTQASELWYGVLSWTNSGQTLSSITSGWTTGDSAVFTSNNTNTGFYQIATSVGTPTLAATISASEINAGVVATFMPVDAVTFDALGPSSTPETSTTATITWTHTAGTGGGTVLVWLVVSTNAAFTFDFTTVTYGGAPMTLLGSEASGASGVDAGGIFCYGITGAASGANTVSATCSVTPSDKLIGWSESYVGGSAFGTPATAQAESETSGSIAVSTVDVAGLVAAGLCNGSGGTTWTAGTSRMTYTGDTSTASGNAAAADSAATGGTVTLTWTQSVDDYGAVAVEILAPSGGTPPVIETTSLSNASVGEAYAVALGATSGTSPYTWSVSSGSLPSWASLASSTGIISGTPSSVAASTFTVEVTDAHGNTDTQSLTLAAVPALAYSPARPGLAIPGLVTPGLIPSTTNTESGSFNITLPTLTTSLTGSTTVFGSFNIVLPTLTTSLAGTAQHTESGAFNITLPTLRTTLAGSTTVFGSFNITLPTLTTSLAGSTTVFGPFVIALPTLSTSLTGVTTVFGGFNITLPTLSTSLAGATTVFGSFAITLPTLTTALQGATTVFGGFNIVLPVPTTSLIGSTTVFGGFNIVLPVPTTELTGSVGSGESGPFAITLPVPTTSLSGTAQHTESGPFNIALPVPSTSLTGSTTVFGSFAITLPVLKTSLAGAAQHTESGPFNIALPVPTTSLTGITTVFGSFAITLPVPQTSLAGTLPQTITAAFVIVLPPGQRNQIEAGELAIVLPSLTTSLQARVGESGSFEVSLPTLSVSLTGTAQQTITGSFAIVLPGPSTELVAHVPAIISGPLVLALPVADVSLNGLITHVGVLSIYLGVQDMMLTRYEMFGCESIGELTGVLPVPRVELTGRVVHKPSGQHLSAWLRAKRTRSDRHHQLRAARRQAQQSKPPRQGEEE